MITATGAAEPVLTRTRVAEAVRPRRDRPLFIIDIAVPRDVEASVGDLDQVFLYNIDDLQTIVKENLARRSGELARVTRRAGIWIHVESGAGRSGWIPADGARSLARD